MKLHQLTRIQTLPVQIEEAWQFFSSPRNLPSITPPWLNLVAMNDIPDSMHPGMVIQYRVKPLLGIPVNWLTEITHVDAPRYFVDEQRFGPYRFWHHEHHFRRVNGGVEMVDQVLYGLKYGSIGKLMHALIIRRRLEAIFDFRQRALEKIFRISR